MLLSVGPLWIGDIGIKVTTARISSGSGTGGLSSLSEVLLTVVMWVRFFGLGPSLAEILY